MTNQTPFLPESHYEARRLWRVEIREREHLYTSYSETGTKQAVYEKAWADPDLRARLGSITISIKEEGR